MSKERLEEIETIQNNAYFTYGEVNKAEIDLAEFKWLIQQVKEKIQLEEELEHSTKKEVETSEKLLKAQIENQRYKQALEQVKQSLIKANKGYVNNRDHYVNFNIHESLETIEALQGGNTNE